MITIQLLIILIFAMGVFSFERSLTHPGMIMTGSWLVMLVFQLLGLIHYEYEVISPELILLQTFFVGMFIIGAVARVPGLNSGVSSGTSPQSQQGMDLVVLCLVAGLIVLSAIVAIEISKVGFSVFNIREMRTAHWNESEEYSHDLLSLTKAFTRPMVLTLIIMAPSFTTWMPRMAAFAGFLVAGIAESLLVGGRFFLGFCIVGWMMSYLLHRDLQTASWRLLTTGRLIERGGLLRKVMFSSGAVLTFVLCFGVFPSIRNPDLVGREDLFLSSDTGNSAIAPYIKNLRTRTGFDSLTVFAFGSNYITSAMMRSNYLLRESDVTDWRLLGGNNFPLLSKLRTMLFGGRTSEQRVKERIAEAQPFGKNPWIGGVIDIVIDFGIFGGGVFMFIYGVISGVVYRAYRDRKQPEILAAASVLCISLIAFPYLSLLRTSATTYTLIVCFMASMLRLSIGNVYIDFGTGSLGRQKSRSVSASASNSEESDQISR